jgi:hypothetical protein
MMFILVKLVSWCASKTVHFGSRFGKRRTVEGMAEREVYQNNYSHAPHIKHLVFNKLNIVVIFIHNIITYVN